MELNGVSTSHISSPYGRACANCARAKAKCIPGSGVGVRCERYFVCHACLSENVKLGLAILTHTRCLRLNKDCQPTQSVRNRKTSNKQSAVKAERLEAKLDGLYKLLQSSAASSSIAGPSISVPGALSSRQPFPQSLQTPAASPGDGGGPDLRPRSLVLTPNASYVVSGTRSTISHCPETLLMDSSEPSFDEAEECLNFFRTSMTTYFPFVLVSDSMTARELRHDRPFLWLCIMSIASKSTVQQRTLAREIRITMGRELLVEGRNNIDLLLGILVFLAWYVLCVQIARV